MARIRITLGGCVLLSTQGVFGWAVRLMRPTVIREPRAATPKPPSKESRQNKLSIYTLGCRV
jgi:hypothetical protein